MGLDVNTNGADEFRRLAADLRRVGAKGIQKRLYAALSRSTRPAIKSARASAASTLPKGGGRDTRRKRLVTTAKVQIDGREYRRRRFQKLGTTAKTESLADRVSQAKFMTKAVRPKGGTATVRVIAASKKGKSVDLNALDAGRVRHPLFGNRRHWYQQSVPAGWFTRPMEANADNVQAELQSAVREIERDITGR